jgi:DNA invertase Pin-like site-specific DNA recombinase
MAKVAIYYRVSTDKQDFESQKIAVEKYLRDRDITDPIIYSDHGMSGTDSTRPAFRKLQIDGKAGAYKTLVVYRIDRIGRKSYEAMEFILMLAKWGVDFVSVTQPHLTTSDNPFRLAMIAIMTDLAQIEREIMVERVKHGLAAAKAAGVRLGAPPKLDAGRIELAHALRLGGLSYREIGVKLGVTHTTIFAALNYKKSS